MNHSRIEYCQICTKIIKIDWKDVEPNHGAVITFGYSRGGWGSRRNHITFSGEICDECYKEYEEIAKKTIKWLNDRKDKNKPNISINYMSNMLQDKPQPNGYFGKVLRLLS